MKSEPRNKSLLTPLMQWLIGDANRHDERSLDAAAQSDPFLADALEGYRALPEADHVADVTRLKAKLRQQTQRQRGAGFYALRIAAVGAVLVAAWLVMQQFANNDKAMVADAVQMEAPTTDAAPPIAADSVQPELAEQTTTAYNIASDESAKEPQKVLNRPVPPKASSPTASSAPTPTAPPTEQAAHENLKAVADDEVATSQADKDKAMEVAKAKEEAERKKLELEEAAKKKSEEYAARRAKEKPEERVPAAASKTSDSAAAKEKLDEISKKKGKAPQPRQITGKVTDGNGSPLVGVTVKAIGSNISAVTNIDGSYSLNLPAGVVTLEFSLAGYNTQKVNLGKKNQVDIELQEN
ncbi:MAG: carboxypeptidase-like regulatory domain-containing protein [Saprospiraceae bacterium]|nr:carboxypeptidase-like regulatory domain-containing protein [Saprospiraceae bacterium]